MDILESSADLGALLRGGSLVEFAKAHFTGLISFHSMVVCDMSGGTPGCRMRMVDYAIAHGNMYHAKHMIKYGAPITTDLNEEMARVGGRSVEGNWYTTLGHAIHHSQDSVIMCLLEQRSAEVDVTQPAVFMERSAIKLYSGLQYAMDHAEISALQLMAHYQQPIPSRSFAPALVRCYVKPTMWDEWRNTCVRIADELYKQAKLREEGALAAVWCCTRAVQGPWFDVWFHLAPHMALTDVDWMNDKGEATGRKRQRMDGQLKKK